MKQIDRIRSMNAEELARFLWEHDEIDTNISICDFCLYGEINNNNCNIHKNCTEGIKAWFESEVEE